MAVTLQGYQLRSGPEHSPGVFVGMQQDVSAVLYVELVWR